MILPITVPYKIILRDAHSMIQRRLAPYGIVAKLRGTEITFDFLGITGELTLQQCSSEYEELATVWAAADPSRTGVKKAVVEHFTHQVKNHSLFRWAPKMDPHVVRGNPAACLAAAERIKFVAMILQDTVDHLDSLIDLSDDTEPTVDEVLL